MKLLCITDMHNHKETVLNIVHEAKPVDIALLGGDLTNFGSPDDAENIVQIVQSIANRVFAVAGNCDSALIDERLHKLGVSVAGQCSVIEGVAIHGISAAPPWLSKMYGLTEDEMAKDLAAGFQQVQNAKRHIVLAHVPPRGTKLDRNHFFQHIGSSALREFIDNFQPDLVVCGHVHEAAGIDTIGRTTVVNCGPAASGCYAIAELSDVLRVELHRLGR